MLLAGDPEINKTCALPFISDDDLASYFEKRKQSEEKSIYFHFPICQPTCFYAAFLPGMRLFSKANSFHSITGFHPLLPTQGHQFTKHPLYSASSIFLCFQSAITSIAKSNDQFSGLILLDWFIALNAVESSLLCETLSSLVTNPLSLGSPQASVGALSHSSMLALHYQWTLSTLGYQRDQSSGSFYSPTLTPFTSMNILWQLSKIISLAQLLPWIPDS